MEPLSLEDLQETSGLQSEFTKDFIIMKVCLLGVSYFCLSSEMYFLQSELDQSEHLHNKTIKLLLGFLPENCPLVRHVGESFKKRFENEMEEIVRNIQPEEDLPINILNNSRLPYIRDRPGSLSPAFKFKKMTRRASERPKTVTNFENVVNNKLKTPKYTKWRNLKLKRKINSFDNKIN